MLEYVFRIDLGLDLHQSRQVVAPIGFGIAAAEIEIAIVHIASLETNGPIDVYKVSIIAMFALVAPALSHCM